MRSSEQFYFDERTEVVEKAYEKARNLVGKYEIDPNDFRNLYGNDVVQEDLRYVEDMENKFESEYSKEQRESKRMADILEAILFEQSEQSNWLGENVATIKTSQFDDIYHGVDAVAEFKEGERMTSHVAFAIDATFTSAETKFKKIKTMIDEGQLAKVKYFTSEVSPVRGELSRIPLTVVSADFKTIQELAQMWVDNEKEGLAKHWIQFQCLEELFTQCDVFAQYAKQVNQKVVADQYSHIKSVVRDIQKVKSRTMTDPGIRDSTFWQTISNLEMVLKN